MIWADREANRLKQRNLPLEWVDDMKTPSGRIHVGSLRGVIIHDMIYKALKDIGVNAQFSYVFNDMDSMDALPSYLDKSKYEKYMGFPLYKIPSPVKGYKSYADYFAQEFIDVFQKLNCYPKIIWSSDLYRQGKMNDLIKIILNNAEKIREIYKKIAKAEKSDNWYPYNPICEKCGKVGTTNVYKWDGKYVYYRCEYHIVDWANGCGYEGKIEPINENGKLPWKLDWPTHWKTIGITIESSGKDHMSSGGSYDVASHIAKEVLNYNPPDAIGGYEWFTVGGKKMSSSKGIGTSAKECSEILPSNIFRFLIVRTNIKTHLDFNPYGDTIPRLFDEYDRCLNSFFLKLENRLPEGKQGEIHQDLARIIEFSAVSKLPNKRLYLPRFKTIVNLLIHKKTNLQSFFENLKKDHLNQQEIEILNERIKYAKIYLEKYLNLQFSNNHNLKNIVLDDEQENFLRLFETELKKINHQNYDEKSYQNFFIELINKSQIQPKKAFHAFYLKYTGKPFGEKVGKIIFFFIKERFLMLTLLFFYNCLDH